jgi:amino acid transporter
MKKFLSSMLVLNIFLPSIALAQRVFELESDNGVVSEGGGFLGGFLEVVRALLGISFLFAIMFIIIGIFRFLVSTGNIEAAKHGNQTITNAMIGIVIIIVAYTVLNYFGANYGAETINITY